MLSVSSLIEFLLSLLNDDDALAEFDQDPEGVLARNGLDGVTAQDVRDVAPLLADRDGVSVRDADCDPRSGRDQHRSDDGRDDRGWSDRDHAPEHHASPVHHAPAHHAPRHHDDPVREIHHVTNSYHSEPQVAVTKNVYNEYNSYTYNDNRVIDDRDVNGDGNTVTQDSYNQDNDGVDNKGGAITDSAVGGRDVIDSNNDNDGIDNDGVIVDSLNDETVVEDNDTVVSDSFNTEDSSSDDDTVVSTEDSFNSDDDVIDLDVTGRNAAEDPFGQGPAAVDDGAELAADPSAA